MTRGLLCRSVSQYFVQKIPDGSQRVFVVPSKLIFEKYGDQKGDRINIYIAVDLCGPEYHGQKPRIDWRFYLERWPPKKILALAG
jgi:hypothetical protein